jgi:hypothetical protein
MRAIVDGVTCDDETDRWDVQADSVIGICVADVKWDYRIPFKTERAAVERLRSDNMICDLSRKHSLPTLNGVRREGSLHLLDHLRQGKRTGRRKAIAQ